MSKPLKGVLAAVALVTAAAIAYGAGSGENDALSVTSAKISLIQATTAAEQHVHGKAARAEYEKSKGKWVFDVEVVSGAKVFDVKVDANSGTVLGATEDKTDHDDEHDAKD